MKWLNFTDSLKSESQGSVACGCFSARMLRDDLRSVCYFGSTGAQLHPNRKYTPSYGPGKGIAKS